MTEVALLPENKVVVPVKAEERLLIFRLSVADDVGLPNDGFIGIGLALDDSDDVNVCSCHNWSTAFPDFSDLSDPLIDQHTFLLYVS